VSDEKETFNTTGLDNLMKALTDDKSRVRIGILGSTAQRSAEMHTDEVTGEQYGEGVSTVNNAEIGLKHEFGGPSTLPNGVTINLPQRSFLRVPLINQYQKFLEASGAFDRATLASVLKKGTMKRWLMKLGMIGEQVVLEGFDTGGFGEWKPSNMSFKQNHQTLVESQQLRNSIISEVTEGD
jgi:phage gpG-like protein